MQAMLLKYLFG